MKKIVSFLIVLASTTSVSFAYSGHGYTLGKETFTCSKGSNCGIEHLDSNSLDAKKNLMSTSKARAPSKNGKVKAYNQVDGYHEITIVNRTNVSQSYVYSYSLDCADLRASYSRNVTLTPGATFSTSDHTFGVVQKDNPGSFRITAVTKNSGESSSSDTGTGTLSITR